MYIIQVHYTGTLYMYIIQVHYTGTCVSLKQGLLLIRAIPNNGVQNAKGSK